MSLDPLTDAELDALDRRARARPIRGWEERLAVGAWNGGAERMMVTRPFIKLSLVRRLIAELRAARADRDEARARHDALADDFNEKILSEIEIRSKALEEYRDSVEGVIAESITNRLKAEKERDDALREIARRDTVEAETLTRANAGTAIAIAERDEARAEIARRDATDAEAVEAARAFDEGCEKADAEQKAREARAWHRDQIEAAFEADRS